MLAGGNFLMQLEVCFSQPPVRSAILEPHKQWMNLQLIKIVHSAEVSLFPRLAKCPYYSVRLFAPLFKWSLTLVVESSQSFVSLD